MKSSARNIFLVSVLVVILAAVFASSFPDGLEKVAKILGFKHKGTSSPSVFIDYNLSAPFMTNGIISTVIAGFIGVFIVYAVFRLAGFLISRSFSNKKAA